MSRVIPFSYHGSKYTLVPFLDDVLPRTRQYVEPFGGSGVVLLNRDPVPVETYNDLEGDLVNFLRVLRDRPGDLLRALRLTPYSREELGRAAEARHSGYEDVDELERARLTYVQLQMAREARGFPDGDRGDTSWSYSTRNSPSRGTDSTTTTHTNRVESHLPTIAGRLTDVQLESRPAVDVVETHDTEVATMYVDPPYPEDVRGSRDNYAVEMSREDHVELLEALLEAEAYVAVSSYRNELYDDLLEEWRISSKTKRARTGSGSRTEVVYTNYDPEELGGEKLGDWPEPNQKGRQITLDVLAGGADAEVTADD